jgi:hypothetical protein
MSAADAAGERARAALDRLSSAAPEDDFARVMAVSAVGKLCKESRESALAVARANGVLLLVSLLPEAPPAWRAPRPFPSGTAADAPMGDDGGYAQAPQYAVAALGLLFHALAPKEPGPGGWASDAQLAATGLIRGNGMERLLRLVRALDVGSPHTEDALHTLADVVEACGVFRLLQHALFEEAAPPGEPPLLLALACLVGGHSDCAIAREAARCISACVRSWPHLAPLLCRADGPHAVLGGATLPLLLAQALQLERDGLFGIKERDAARRAAAALIFADEEHAGRRAAAICPDAAHLLLITERKASYSWVPLICALACSPACRARIPAAAVELLVLHALVLLCAADERAGATALGALTSVEGDALTQATATVCAWRCSSGIAAPLLSLDELMARVPSVQFKRALALASSGRYASTHAMEARLRSLQHVAGLQQRRADTAAARANDAAGLPAPPECAHAAALRQLQADAACPLARVALARARAMLRRGAALHEGGAAEPSPFAGAVLSVAAAGYAVCAAFATGDASCSYAHTLGLQHNYGLPELVVTAPPAATRAMALLARELAGAAAWLLTQKPALRAAAARGECIEMREGDVHVLEWLVGTACGARPAASFPPDATAAAAGTVWRFCPVSACEEGDDDGAGRLLMQRVTDDAASPSPPPYARANSRAVRFCALVAPPGAAPEAARAPQLLCSVAACCAGEPGLLAALRALTFVEQEPGGGADSEDAEAEATHLNCVCTECDERLARHVAIACALPGCRARSRAGGLKLSRCAGCAGCAAFCSVEHQTQDWPRHKRDCLRYRKLLADEEQRRSNAA